MVTRAKWIPRSQDFHSYGDGYNVCTFVKKEIETAMSIDDRVNEFIEMHGGSPSAEEINEFVDGVVNGHPESMLPIAGEGVLEAITNGEFGDPVALVVTLSEQPPVHVPPPHLRLYDYLPTIALEAELARLDAIEDRMLEIDYLQTELVDYVESIGGVINSRGWLFNFIQVLIPVSSVDALVAYPDVAHIDTIATLIPEDCDSSYPNCDHLRDDIGIEQYVQIKTNPPSGGPYDGDANPSHRQHVAIFEGHTMDVTEDFLFDDSSHQLNRLSEKGCQVGNGCSIDYWDYDPGEYGLGCEYHAGKVTSAIMGDLIEDQDPSILNTDAQRRRTGMSRESLVTLYWTVAGTFQEAVEDAIIEGLDVINLSGHYYPPAIDCNNDNSYTDTVDYAYDHGIMLVKSAGNQDASCEDCTVTTPGQASTSFTVGALDTIDTYNYVDDDLISGENGSSGGTGDYGIRYIDIVTSGYIMCTPNACGGWDHFSHTSAAAPIVTGLVANMKDHWSTAGFTGSYDTPGIQRVGLLLMGDGAISCCSQQGNHYEQCSTAIAGWRSFDAHWGAGRLFAKIFNDDGMGTPWRAHLGYRFVWDGYCQTVNIDPKGESIPNEVDTGRFVIWWDEPNMGGDGVPAQISFALKEDYPGTFIYRYMQGSDRQNTQRIFMGNMLAGRNWELKICGLNVTENPKIGDNKLRKVYVGFFWEDN